MTLFYTIFHAVAAHCILLPSQSVDLLPAGIKHNIQLYLLLTESVLNTGMAIIVSIDHSDWNNITSGMDQFSSSGGCYIIKNTWNKSSH